MMHMIHHLQHSSLVQKKSNHILLFKLAKTGFAKPTSILYIEKQIFNPVTFRKIDAIIIKKNLIMVQYN